MRPVATGGAGQHGMVGALNGNGILVPTGGSSCKQAAPGQLQTFGDSRTLSSSTSKIHSMLNQEFYC